MADPRQRQPRERDQDLRPPYGGDQGIKSLVPEKGLSSSQILAVVGLLPVGGTLLGLAGITFVGTLILLGIATPVFVLFSPVLVPAAFTIGLALCGFLASGACGITALSAFSWMANYLRRMQVTAGGVGQKAKEVGLKAQEKTQEATGKVQETIKGQEGGRA